MSKRYKVIQWATGQVGMPAMRGVMDHPQLELVGLWCSSEAKEGKDAGELAGRAPVGIRATRNIDDLLALDADCVNYDATDFGVGERVKEVVNELDQILSSGKNVVGPQTILGYAAVLDQMFDGQLSKACERGSSSLYGGGDHGDGTIALTHALTSMSHQIDHIAIREQFNLEAYDEPLLISGFGIGLPPADQGLAPGAFGDEWPMYEHLWNGLTSLLAQGYGEVIEERRHYHEYVVADRTFEVPRFKVEAGTVGAVHHRMDCLIGGEVRISAHGYYWVGRYPQEWLQVFGPDTGYWVNVKGIPDMDMGFNYSGRGQSAADERINTTFMSEVGATVIATGMRPVNSIPAVCEARPGILTMYDLPIFGPKTGWASKG